MQEKKFHLCGLGNALVDTLHSLSDAQFAALGFKRSSYDMVSAEQQQEILAKLPSSEGALISGGSVANSVIAAAQLGARAAFICCVGDDRYGLHFQEEFSRIGIALNTCVVPGAMTGVCLSMVTPDAERTMRTSLGISSHLSAEHVDEELVAQSEWLFIEGYVFANPKTGQGAITRALEYAKRHKTKVAVTCSDTFIVQGFREPLEAAVAQADLLFANEGEACALTGKNSAVQAFEALRTRLPNLVVTQGAKGVLVKANGHEGAVPAFACIPKDLTGAGDMLAGAFLYGFSQKLPIEQVTRSACYLAMKVICHVGARLPHGVPEAWQESLRLSPGQSPVAQELRPA
jgi:sugar/nucleoside kinase (ribokinase family)